MDKEPELAGGVAFISDCEDGFSVCQACAESGLRCSDDRPWLIEAATLRRVAHAQLAEAAD